MRHFTGSRDAQAPDWQECADTSMRLRHCFHQRATLALPYSYLSTSGARRKQKIPTSSKMLTHPQTSKLNEVVDIIIVVVVIYCTSKRPLRGITYGKSKTNSNTVFVAIIHDGENKCVVCNKIFRSQDEGAKLIVNKGRGIKREKGCRRCREELMVRERSWQRVSQTSMSHPRNQARTRRHTRSPTLESRR